MANAPKALSVTPNPKPVETAQPKSDAHTTENPQELPRENGSIPPKTEQNVPKPVPKELSEIRTEKEFEQFVRTVFEEHGALSLENQNQVVQSLLYKWKEYSKLAVKNQSKVGSPEVPSSRDSPGSFLDTEGAIPIDPSKLKRELVAYVDGMRTVSQLMDGIDNWALMSSNSLFLAKKEYRYIPDDFDISIDRKDIGKAWRQLQKLVAS